MSSLEQEEPEVAATAVVGIAKLMLAGMVTDEEVSLTYSIASKKHARSRFPCSLADPQPSCAPLLRQRDGRQPGPSPMPLLLLPRLLLLEPRQPAPGRKRESSRLCPRIALADLVAVEQVFLPTLELLKGVYDDLGDKAAMVAPLQIGLQLIDWTDPQKAMFVLSFLQRNSLADALELLSDVQGVAIDEDIHFDLAMLMVKKLYQEEQSESVPVLPCEFALTASSLLTAEDERKLLCQLLPKLYIPEEIADLKVKSLLWLVASLKVVSRPGLIISRSVEPDLVIASQTRPLADTVSKNALDRFEKALLKTFGERVEALSEEDLAEAVEMKETQDFVAQLVAEDDGSDEDGDEEEEDEEDEDSDEEQSEAEE
jgi:condensin complex subunit 3